MGAMCRSKPEGSSRGGQASRPRSRRSRFRILARTRSWCGCSPAVCATATSTTRMGRSVTAALRPGQTVAVFGCGGVGASVIMGARIAHAGRIIGVDLVASKLEMARQLGATDTIDASKQDPVEAIRELTGGGVDFAFECIG